MAIANYLRIHEAINRFVLHLHRRLGRTAAAAAAKYES
jgi:hypothetical protein